MDQEDLLEKGRTTHSSILAWRIPWTEESGGLQAMGSQRLRHNWGTFIFLLSWTWTILSAGPTVWLSPLHWHTLHHLSPSRPHVPLHFSHFLGWPRMGNTCTYILASGSALKWAQWGHLIHSGFSVNVSGLDRLVNEFSLCPVWAEQCLANPFLKKGEKSLPQTACGKKE